MENFLLVPRALASAFFNAGFAGACGCLLSLTWLKSHNGGVLRRDLLIAWKSCASLLLFVLPIQLYLLTATMVGSASLKVVLAQLLAVLSETHAGRILIPSLIAAALLLGASLLQSSKQRFAGYLAIFLLSVARAATGHASANGDFTLGEAVQFFHLLGMSIWAGGVTIAGFLVLPALQRDSDREAISIFGRSLSRTALVAVLIVAASGFYNAWKGLGSSTRPLLHSQWGVLLVLKSTLVCVAWILGGTNRLLLRKNSTILTQDSRRLSTLLRLEAWTMLAILGVTGFLANSQPPTETL